tara:strand:+ start:1642 stop:2370 length:729 start_codon:yes stop_codon:yes gene_type:complete
LRFYKVGKVEHKVYDPDDSLPNGLIVKSDWRKADIGDWVKADDECVIEVLRKGQMQRKKGKKRVVEYIGTCTGTFVVHNNTKMDTSRRANIYTFGGNKTPEESLLQRKDLTKYERVFVMYLSQGVRPRDAYMKAFPTNDLNYASHKAAQLTKTERIRTAMKEELKPVLEELELDETFVLKNIKEVVLSSDKDDTRLKALFKLADIMDMEDKNATKVTQLSVGAFTGFSPEQIEKAQRPELEE